MKQKFLEFHRKIKEWVTQVLFRKILTPMALVFIYFFVLGPTSIVSKIFFRKKLTKTISNVNTNWNEVVDYEGSLQDSYFQS